MAILRLTPEQLKSHQERRQRHLFNRDEPDPPTSKKPKITARESEVLRSCLDLLRMHSAIAFAWRMNVGMASDGKHWIKFGFRGCSDILGMTRTGRLLAVEVKRPGKKATADQQAFLDVVAACGGAAICVDNVAGLKRFLDDIAISC